MNTKKYLNQVAYIAEIDICGDGDLSKVYKSKFDDSYITHVGMEDHIKHLAKLEITGELTHGVGFSPKDGKWYGWSHRAIYGFEVGSECKKGHCGYQAKNIEDELEAAILFWSGDDRLNITAKVIEDETNAEGKPLGQILVEWTYSHTIPNEQLRCCPTSTVWHYNKEFGKGEWTAETIEDAKQMAIDFNEGVS